MGCRMLPGQTNGRFRSLTATTILLACLSAASGPLGAQSPEKSSPAEPEVSSIYPLGARPGDSLRAEVLGQDLDGCYALWFSQEGLSASIQGVETLESEQPRDYAAGESKPDRPRQRVSLQLEVAPEAGPGEYRLRLVTSRGVSNSLSFLVTPYPAIREGETPELLPLPVAGQRQNPPGRRGRHLRLRSPRRGNGSGLRSSTIPAPLESPAGPFARPSIPS